ncbi:unnamed protein product [Amoebophrya sp. A25]|nr:unnamed protein product [Amoebophrya sp. A25]|eukprot:GSA25T00020674001.1
MIFLGRNTNHSRRRAVRKMLGAGVRITSRTPYIPLRFVARYFSSSGQYSYSVRFSGPPDDEHQSPEQKRIRAEILATRPSTGLNGPFGPWLAAPQIADAAQKLGKACRFDTSLPLRESELLILFVAASTGSFLEWQVHEPEARRAGVPEEVIEALKDMRKMKEIEQVVTSESASSSSSSSSSTSSTSSKPESLKKPWWQPRTLEDINSSNASSHEATSASSTNKGGGALRPGLPIERAAVGGPFPADDESQYDKAEDRDEVQEQEVSKGSDTAPSPSVEKDSSTTTSSSSTTSLAEYSRMRVGMFAQAIAMSDLLELGKKKDAHAVGQEFLLTERERLLLRVAYQLLSTHNLSEELYGEALETLEGEKTLVEVVSIVGYYHYVALTLNVFRPPIK